MVSGRLVVEVVRVRNNVEWGSGRVMNMGLGDK